MGREIRRVSLNFNWPINKVWYGFLNPYRSTECPFCEGSGNSSEAKNLYNQWYGNAPFDPSMTGQSPFNSYNDRILSMAVRNTNANSLANSLAVRMEADRLARHFNSSWCHHLDQDDVDALVEADRLRNFTRDFIPEEGRQDNPQPLKVAASEVNLWSLNGFGHDSISAWVCVKAKAARLGFDPRCDRCQGSGELWASEEVKKLSETWKEFDPPSGEGWQFWENVTEGSPQSPVFSTPEDLVDWLVDYKRYARELAEHLIETGWAPSVIAYL